MTILTILSPEEIRLFEMPPQFHASERKQFFSIPKWAEEVLEILQTPDSKTGFLLLFGYFRATNKFYLPVTFASADIAFVQRRLTFVPTGQLALYPKTTLHRHKRVLRDKLGVSRFSSTAQALLAKEIDFLLSKQMRLKDIFGTLVAKLDQLKIEIPSYYRLADLITEGFRAYEKHLLTTVAHSLQPEDKQLLDSLLKTDQAYLAEGRQDLKVKRYAVTLLKRPNQSTKPAKIKANIQDLLILRELFDKLQSPIATLHLSPDMIWHYATVVIKTQIFQIARRDERRYLFLLCFIIHQYYCLQDLLIDIVLKVEQTADNKARRKQKEAYFACREDRGHATAVLTTAVESAEAFRAKVTRIVLSACFSPSEKLARLEQLIRQDTGAARASEQDALSLLKQEGGKGEREADYYEALQEQSLWLQKRATDIIKAVRFNHNTSRSALVEAIDHFVKTEGKIGEHPSSGFLNKKEQQNIRDRKGHLRISLYKMLLLQHVARGTKSGGLNLIHSYRYRSLDEYMIPKERWVNQKAVYLKRAGLEKFADCEAVLKALAEKLDAQYKTTNNHILAGGNRHVVIHGDHQFTLSTPKQDEVHDPPIDLFPQSRFVPLCEVLATINRVTGFLRAFRHIQRTHVHQKPEEKLFYAGITGLGCNITISKLAQISKEVNQSSLEQVVLTYFSNEVLVEASDIILAFAKRLPLNHIFDRPDGMVITASDGQKYPVHGETLLASRSYKYFGKDEGITAYTFRDIHDFLYHSTVFSPTDREAMYVIDGMMHNTVVKSDMHAVDTHGVTPLTFAAMHFLGIFFAPRIAGLDKRRLSAFAKRKIYQEQEYRLLPDTTSNSEIIREQWDEILRFMATIILKETPASQLFERLNSYSHQHPLYKALKEFGQIVETIFILRYVDEPEIRQAVEKELNKLEHVNRFSKAVFHDNNHEFRQETREEQLIAEGCKRLIENAIILWNYLYLSEKVAAETGHERHELLSQIRHSSLACWEHINSLACWEHINLLGEYDFSDERVNTITKFDFPKILGLEVA